jgi:hypothetical protein
MKFMSCLIARAGHGLRVTAARLRGTGVCRLAVVNGQRVCTGRRTLVLHQTPAFAKRCLVGG